jgi:CheY-like chemotaxis protein
MEAMGQLAGGIAHDFNNMLTAILSYAEIVQRRLGRESPLSGYVEEIRLAGERCASLTRQILAFSRKQVLHARDIDLNEVIHGLLKLLDRVLGEHVEIDFIPGRDLGTVRADPVQMEQVVLNLCVNARDAMPEGGRITIETEDVLVSGEYARTHPWARPGRYVLLSVSDTGAGIPPEVLEHVFEPFFTTKATGKGTGLGLATVYGVVQQHGGMIQAYSEIAAGTAFKIYLPIVQRQASAVESKIVPGVPRGAETILLAEDDEVVRRLAIRILEGAGYAVHVARNGEEAVSIFEAHADEIALVLFDVVMPKIGGRAALSRIRALRPDTRFLLCSGYTGVAAPEDLLPEEEARWLSKPYNPETLLRKVREALDG